MATLKTSKKSRLYDFVANTSARSQQVDDEFNQLITQENNTVDDLSAINSEASSHKTAATLDHPDGSVTNAKLASNAVTTAKIADANVTTAKILDANVTNAKLASNSVTTAKITDANVTTAKIADGAVSDVKIGNRLVNQLITDIGNDGTLTQLFSWLARAIYKGFGTTDWKLPPTRTVEEINTDLVRHESSSDHDSRYYTETEVDGIMSTHKTTSTLDHPDASVTTPKIKDGAVTLSKLDPAIQTQVGIGQVEARVTVVEDLLEATAINSATDGTFDLSTEVPVASIDAKVNGGLNFEMTAKPLVANQLGNVGNFEKDSDSNGVADGWTGTSVTACSVSGNVQNFTPTAQFGGIGSAAFKLINSHKYYMACNMSTTDVNAKLYIMQLNGGNTPTLAHSGSGKYERLAAIVTATSDQSTPYLKPQTEKASNFVAISVKEVMLIDLTAMFGAGNEPAIAWCNANIQYVNGIQPMMGLDVKACGKNLFDKSRAVKGYGINSSGNLASNAGLCATGFMPVKKGAQYKLSHVVTSAAWYTAFYDSNMNFISAITSSADNISPTAPANGYVRATYYPTDEAFFQFEEGTVTTTYEPYQGSELLINSEFAGIGSYLDKLTYKNGVAKAIRNVKKMIVDGNNAFVFTYDYVGYKVIECPVLQSTNNPVDIKSMKYNGKILTIPGAEWSTADQCLVTIDKFYVSIADIDSGWGEAYTPSAAEMQAFMNGWKMNNGTFGTPYNGTGTKTWTTWDATSNTGAVTVCPTTKATGWTAWATLWYALATPQEELLDTPIDGLSVYEGKTTIAIQTGIVKERANPVYNAANSNYYINCGTTFSANVPNGSEFSKRAKKILNILKNGVSDLGNWTIYAYSTPETIAKYGNERLATEAAKVDLTATYEVIYEVLHEQYDSQQVSLSAEYTANLVDSHNALVKSVAEVANEVAQKADKAQPGWLDAILLNGWTQHAVATVKAGYYKDEFGVVRLRGMIAGGTITRNTLLFILPVGYRPRFGHNYTCRSQSNGTTDVLGTISISEEGGVYIMTGQASALCIDTSFRAEV